MTLPRDQVTRQRHPRTPGRYYQAIQDATAGTDSAPFIDFMQRMIHEALEAGAPQATPQVTPQVAWLLGMPDGEWSRDERMAALNLSDRKSLRERYLPPALADGLIEMTQPATPNSPAQRYRLTDTVRRIRVDSGFPGEENPKGEPRHPG